MSFLERIKEIKKVSKTFDKSGFHNYELKIGDKVRFKRERFQFLSEDILYLEDKEYEIGKINHVEVFDYEREEIYVLTCLELNDLLQHFPAHHFVKSLLKDRKTKLEKIYDSK